MERAYIALLVQDQGRSDWGILFPDFPGCTSHADTLDQAAAQAAEALALHIEGMAEDSEAIPAPGSANAWPEGDTAADYTSRQVVRLLVPVEAPGRTVRINVTIEESLLERADRTAKKLGSGLITRKR